MSVSVWILDVYIPAFNSGFFKGDFYGKLLILSSQLWSLLNDEVSRSALIGPGYIYGRVTLDHGEITYDSPIVGVIFDPTELRPGSETPLVDILNPEVIDPLGKKPKESVAENIRKVITKKGMILAPSKLAEVKSLASIPVNVVEDEIERKVVVSHISGLHKAIVIIKGQNRHLFLPFKDLMLKEKYSNPDEFSVLCVDKRTLASFNEIKNSGWIIVEKAQLSGSKYVVENAFEEEYQYVLNFVKENQSYYILVNNNLFI
ncbi:MAG: hypothetical protein ACTSSJ_01620 [Candidatus Odinarchaeia archaeon]